MNYKNDVFLNYIKKIESKKSKDKLISIFNKIDKNFPMLNKKIAWNHPIYTHNDTFIIGFSVAKNHISIAPEKKTINIFENEISQLGYEKTENLFRIKSNQNIDYNLILEMVKYNMEDKKDLKSFWR